MASCSCTAGWMQRSPTTGACIRPTSPPSSTSSMPPACRGRRTPRIGGAQPVGSTTYVTGTTPGSATPSPVVTTGPAATQASRLRSCQQPDEPGGYRRASPASPAPSRQTRRQRRTRRSVRGQALPDRLVHVAHRRAGGTQNSVSYPAQPASRADHAGVRRARRVDTGATESNCDANHVANLDDPTYGLAHDLSLPATEVPAFNWITPNNCSDAHDATCQGNNLSGAFNANGTPELHPGRPSGLRPRGHDSAQLHRRALRGRPLPALLHSSHRAVRGLQRWGLIDITFDEANPPFTVGNSFNNAPAPGDSTTSSPRPISRATARPVARLQAPTLSTAPTAFSPTRPARTSTAPM